MGYGSYQTPLGMAGYNIDDVCNRDDCDEKINRGVDALCGDQPGYETSEGCGRWFCSEHLYSSGMADGLWRCPACFGIWHSEHPEFERI
jgi:hypothetical protein